MRRFVGHRVRHGFGTTRLVLALTLLLIGSAPSLGQATVGHTPSGRVERSHLARTKIYLAAADYRHALEACGEEIRDYPSAASYVYLTYVLHAIDAYLEFLAKGDQWGAVDRLYINLAYRDPQDLVDPSGGLTRMAKEMIQTSVRQQADIAAAMASRLDRGLAERLWQQQATWRQSHPEEWWTGVPEAWHW